MNRRDFLRSLLATSALAASPALLAQALKRAELSGLVRDQVFFLDAPLYVPAGADTRIMFCIFQAINKYTGPMLIIEDGVRGVSVMNCIFKSDPEAPREPLSAIERDTGIPRGAITEKVDGGTRWRLPS